PELLSARSRFTSASWAGVVLKLSGLLMSMLSVTSCDGGDFGGCLIVIGRPLACAWAICAFTVAACTSGSFGQSAATEVVVGPEPGGGNEAVVGGATTGGRGVKSIGSFLSPSDAALAMSVMVCNPA